MPLIVLIQYTAASGENQVLMHCEIEENLILLFSARWLKSGGFGSWISLKDGGLKSIRGSKFSHGGKTVSVLSSERLLQVT